MLRDFESKLWSIEEEAMVVKDIAAKEDPRLL
jgi:hypothetical protein